MRAMELDSTDVVEGGDQAVRTIWSVDVGVGVSLDWESLGLYSVWHTVLTKSSLDGKVDAVVAMDKLHVGTAWAVLDVVDVICCCFTIVLSGDKVAVAR